MVGWILVPCLVSQSLTCICVVAYLCICNGWLDAGAMFVESLPHLKVAQHCVAAFPNIVSPTYYHSMTHVIQYLKLEHAMRRDSRRVTHTTLDTIWHRMKQVGLQPNVLFLSNTHRKARKL